MTCCDDPRCKRSYPFVISLSYLTDRVYLISKYKRINGRIIEAQGVKHDITDQILKLLDKDRERWLAYLVSEERPKS